MRIVCEYFFAINALKIRENPPLPAYSIRTRAGAGPARAGPSEMRNNSAFDRARASKLPRLLLAAALALCLFPRSARADTDPSNDSDSLIIRITPRVDFGVAIDTADVNLNFTLDMGATDFTVSPTTITILGNIQPQELDIQAANISASPVWTLDADETAELDQVQIYSLFSVNRSSEPLQVEFDGAKNLVTGAVKRAGVFAGSAANGNFENNQMLGETDMDDLNVGDERQLWFRIDTPPYTSTTQDQDIQITITATKDDI